MFTRLFNTTVQCSILLQQNATANIKQIARPTDCTTWSFKKFYIVEKANITW